MRCKQKCFQSSVFAVKPQWLLHPGLCWGQGAVQDQAWGAVRWDKWLHLLLVEEENHAGRKRCCFWAAIAVQKWSFLLPYCDRETPSYRVGKRLPELLWREVFRVTNLKFFFLLFKITLKYSVKTKIFCSEFLWLPKLLTNSQCLCCDRGVRNLPGLAAGGMWGRVSLSMLGWFPQLIPAYCELILSVSSLWECRIRLSGCWVSCQPVATLIRFFSAVSWAFQAWI